MFFSFSDYLSYNVLDLLLGSYIIFSLAFVVSLSSMKRFDFPSLTSSLTSATLFYIVMLLCLPTATESSLVLSSYFGSLSLDVSSSVLRVVVLLIAFFVILVGRGHQVIGSTAVTSFELDTLICCSLYALMVLVSSNDFLVLYLAIELQSLAFYALVAINSVKESSVEAGVKYFTLGALSSCLLLFGFAMVYAGAGSISFDALVKLDSASFSLASFGVLLILSSLLFKLGMVPFHMWLIDVYEGSATTLTLFFSTVPKLVLVFLLLKLMYVVFPWSSDCWTSLCWFAGLGSVILASVAALYQRRLKRLLSYSSVSHLGFIVLGLSANSLISVKASLIYIAIYCCMVVASFSIILLSIRSAFYPKYLINWIGVMKRHLFLSLLFVLSLFAVAGIPPLAGFYAKLSVVVSLLNSGFWLSSMALVVLSCVSCFYYIRLIKILCFTTNKSQNHWFVSTNRQAELSSMIFALVTGLFLARSEIVEYIAILISTTIL